MEYYNQVPNICFNMLVNMSKQVYFEAFKNVHCVLKIVMKMYCYLKVVLFCFIIESVLLIYLF